MARPKYPLSTLEQVRQKKVDASAEALAEARVSREAAESMRDEKVNEKKALEMRAQAIGERERERFSQAGMTVDELARRFDFEEGVRVGTNALTEQIQIADEQVNEARSVEHETRRELHDRIADRNVIDKDKERFLAAAQKRADAKEEEQVEEAWRPKRT